MLVAGRQNWRVLIPINPVPHSGRAQTLIDSLAIGEYQVSSGLSAGVDWVEFELSTSGLPCG